MLNPGDILNQRYRIASVLGQGGMGVVYKAWDMRLNMPVALKLMLPQPGIDAALLKGLREQFFREAQTLAQLQHSNLVKVTDFFEERGRDVLIMQFIAGESLQSMIDRRGALPEAEVLGYADQLLDALAYIHRHNVIHRDIKPANIIIQADGRPVLVDFGLVKLWDPNDPRTRTTIAGLGTPAYTPPEQYGGRGSDARSDLYSFGATLYHALSGGEPPSVTDRLADPTELKPLYTVRPNVSRPVAEVVMQALALVKEARPASAGAMRDALKPPAPAPTQLVPPARVAPASRARWGGVALAGVLGLLLGFLIGYAVSGGAATTPEVVEVVVTQIVVREVEVGGEVVEVTRLVEVVVTPTPTGASTGTDGNRRTLTLPGSNLPFTQVFVPAGAFTMGSDVGNNDEQPVHEVLLDAFWIDQTEVTNAQYAACVAADNCELPSNFGSYTRGSYYEDAAFADYPVIWVSWNDAAAYCGWRGAVLPTEAQWEKAARGTDGRTYPWGEQIDGTRLNFCDVNCPFDSANATVNDGYTDTAPVGSYPAGASPYGALDMAGNVWEWVADWYDGGYYAIAPDTNPTGPQSGSFRVLRGGSWSSYASNVRAALRNLSVPTVRNSLVGFRCAQE